MLRVHCVRVPAIPHHFGAWIDESALDDGEEAIYAWLTAGSFTEERARLLVRRFDRRYPAQRARALVRDLERAVAS